MLDDVVVPEMTVAGKKGAHVVSSFHPCPVLQKSWLVAKYRSADVKVFTLGNNRQAAQFDQ